MSMVRETGFAAAILLIQQGMANPAPLPRGSVTAARLGDKRSRYEVGVPRITFCRSGKRLRR
jgi:hypothetical protein